MAHPPTNLQARASPSGDNRGHVTGQVQPYFSGHTSRSNSSASTRAVGAPPRIPTPSSGKGLLSYVMLKNQLLTGRK